MSSPEDAALRAKLMMSFRQRDFDSLKAGFLKATESYSQTMGLKYRLLGVPAQERGEGESVQKKAKILHTMNVIGFF